MKRNQVSGQDLLNPEIQFITMKKPYHNKLPQERAATLTQQMRERYAREPFNPASHTDFAQRLLKIVGGHGDYAEHLRAAQELAAELYTRNEQATKAQTRMQRGADSAGTSLPD